MELIDRLREIMSRDFGINSDAELMQAVENAEELDIGIFVMPLEVQYEQAAV